MIQANRSSESTVHSIQGYICQDATVEQAKESVGKGAHGTRISQVMHVKDVSEKPLSVLHVKSCMS